MCILAGLGTAGVPGGSLPLVVGVLVTIGVPGESIAIILGIDRLLDMCRTCLNVTGDLVCAVLVAKGETKKVGYCFLISFYEFIDILSLSCSLGSL